MTDNHINNEDCLIILTSRYKQLPDDGEHLKTIMFPDDLLPDGNQRVFQGRNIIKGYRNIRFVENKINSYFNGDFFYLYLLNTCSDINSTLVTMKQCKGYYLVEEGTASYLNPKEIPTIFTGLKNKLLPYVTKLFERYTILKSSTFAYNNKYFLGSIAITPKAFPDIPGEHIIINSPFSKIHLSVVPDVILSIDASILLTLKDKFPDKLYKNISIFFNKQNYKTIAIKFHPIYYSDTYSLELFKNGLLSIFGPKLIVLDELSNLENYFYSYKIDFCSDFSSVGIYASNFGCNCYSYAQLFKFLYPESDYDEKYCLHRPDILRDSYYDIPVMDK